jgi:hypothetical protein
LYLAAGGSFSFYATLLREKSPLAQNVLQSLSSDGLIIASTGTYPFSSNRYVPREMYIDPTEEHNDEHSTLLDWMIHLLGDGTIIEKCMEYSEFVPHSNSKLLRQPLQRFNIVMKDQKLMSNWIVTDAEINVATQKLMAKPSSLKDDEDISLPVLHFFLWCFNEYICISKSFSRIYMV